MPDFAALANKQQELVRKSLDGSAFIAAPTAAPIANLTTYTAGPPAVISLTELPADWDDLGLLTGDGMAFSRDVTTSDVTSFGRTTPTRTDITADTTTVTVACQETKLLTIGLATGLDLANVVADPNTGEVRVSKPLRPASKHWRVLTVSVDEGDAGEIYIARFFPNAKVTSYAEQAFTNGDEALTWGVTLTGEADDTLGYSEQWLFGGPGWNALLTQMGFTAA